MKNLVIIGAGGMGRTLFDMSKESIGYNTEFKIKGFIDDNPNSLDGFRNYPPLLSGISEYQIDNDDVFICSIGGQSRRKCMENIISKGGVFLSMIHRTARIGTNVKLGQGNLVGAFTTIAADAKIGDFNFIQSHVIIGHDVCVGKWNRIDSYVMCIGGIRIGDGNMIHTAAVINHNVEIADNSHIGACSFVIRNVDSGVTVAGNPARRII